MMRVEFICIAFLYVFFLLSPNTAAAFSWTRLTACSSFAKDDLGYTSLMEAIEDGDVQVVNRLLRRNPERQLLARLGLFNLTPLMLACGHGHVAVVNRLLQWNPESQLFARDSMGMSPLMTACSLGHVQVVDRLLQYNPERQLLERLGLLQRTPLMWACSHGHLQVVNRLLQCNLESQLLTRDAMDRTSLMLACSHGHVQVVNRLLQSFPSEIARDFHIVLNRDRYGNTALMYAIQGGSKDVVNALLDCNRKQEHLLAENKNGQTALKLARSKGSIEILTSIETALLEYHPGGQLLAKRNNGSKAEEIGGTKTSRGS